VSTRNPPTATTPVALGVIDGVRLTVCDGVAETVRLGVADGVMDIVLDGVAETVWLAVADTV